MVIVNINKDTVYLDANLRKNLDNVKNAVLHKNFDYLSIIAGNCGVGKSTLAQQICKYLDNSFNTKDRICFTGIGKEGLIKRTSNAKLGQAFMLDESFASMNTKLSRNYEFMKIVNHLQLIRQKGLFIILCLPNFFDLNKGIAIFRASHLFVVYTRESYNRGYFAAFDRERKKELYVKGIKFLNYHAVKPNFRGRFVKKWVTDFKLYEKLKAEHLIEQGKEGEPKTKKSIIIKNNFIRYLKEVENWKAEKIALAGKISTKTVYNSLKQIN